MAPRKAGKGKSKTKGRATRGRSAKKPARKAARSSGRKTAKRRAAPGGGADKRVAALRDEIAGLRARVRELEGELGARPVPAPEEPGERSLF
jgi:hypothetical protein